MKLSDKITNLTTLKNAWEYHKTPDKWLFCLELLDISMRRNDADFWVHRLEDRFDALISKVKSGGWKVFG
jgi:hypothetical protein